MTVFRDPVDSNDAEEDGDVTVLVTGFGPFLDQFPVNPSSLIASALPRTLEPTVTHPTRIAIRKHPDPVHTAYRSTLALVPFLLESSETKSSPDVVLHLGLASGREYFTLERGAHRGGYFKKRDLDGETYEDEEGVNRWPDCPEYLESGFDIDDIYARWNNALTAKYAMQDPRDETLPSDHVATQRRPVDVRPNDDAGNYMCGFIYYNSLAWFHNQSARNGEDRDYHVERPVAFMHVPPLPTDELVEVGTQVTIELIRAMVQSRQQGQSSRPKPWRPRSKSADREPVQVNDDSIDLS